jgi:hypothetical protein
MDSHHNTEPDVLSAETPPGPHGGASRGGLRRPGSPSPRDEAVPTRAAGTSAEFPARPPAPAYVLVTEVHRDGPAAAFRYVAADGQPPVAGRRAFACSSPVQMLRFLDADSPVPGTARYLLRTRNSWYVAFVPPPPGVVPVAGSALSTPTRVASGLRGIIAALHFQSSAWPSSRRRVG